MCGNGLDAFLRLVIRDRNGSLSIFLHHVTFDIQTNGICSASAAGEDTTTATVA